MQAQLFGESFYLFEQKDCLNVHALDGHTLHQVTVGSCRVYSVLGQDVVLQEVEEPAGEGGPYWGALSARVHVNITVRFSQRVGEGQPCPWLCIHACLCFAEPGVQAGCNFTHKSADVKHGSSIFKLGKNMACLAPEQEPRALQV